MANYPEMQARMRQELEDVVGDDTPTIEHKARCPYTNAFISEVTRFRSVSPLGFNHKAMVDSSIRGFRIKAGTEVMLHHNAIMMSEQHWTEPEVFNPLRFIDDVTGQHNARLPAFLTFGVGRRACPGEKLALVNLFLIVARLCYATRGQTIVLPGGPGSVDITGDPNNSASFLPHKYEIVIRNN